MIVVDRTSITIAIPLTSIPTSPCAGAQGSGKHPKSTYLASRGHVILLIRLSRVAAQDNRDSSSNSSDSETDADADTDTSKPTPKSTSTLQFVDLASDLETFHLPQDDPEGPSIGMVNASE